MHKSAVGAIIWQSWIIFAFISGVVALPATAVAEVQPPGAEEVVPEGEDTIVEWWTPRYLVGYGLIGAGLSGYAVGHQMTAREEARIGPSYDPSDPTQLLEVEEVNRPFRERDTIPLSWVHGYVFVAGFSIAGMEIGQWQRGRGSGQRLHDAVVGYMEASALTAAVTSLAKPRVGRLRPDFAERALRFHCSQPEANYGPSCEEFAEQPLDVSERRSRRQLNDGQKSFFSGHASSSFAMATYASLVVGGNYVWGDDASRRSRVVGGIAQSLLMGSATLISATRITDGRHHFSDVAIGAAVGAGFANLSYWRRFERSGALRFRDRDWPHVVLRPAAEHTGAVLALSW